MTGLREKRKQETRKAIQDAAVKLFTEKSFEKTSIEDIAKEAGIGKTTVYGYFSTKEEIFINYCDDELDQAFANLQSNDCSEKRLLDRLVDFFMLKFTFITKNREFGRQLLREMVFPSTINEKAKAHDQRYFDRLENLFSCAQKNREIPMDQDLFFLSVHFFSLYLGVLAGWYTGYLNNLEEAEEGMRKLFNQALEGVAL
jgi:AcrR family transcriptional regulator